jgi:hypothetical protein
MLRVHITEVLLLDTGLRLHKEGPVQWLVVIMECLQECHPMVNLEACRQEGRHTVHRHHMVGVEVQEVLDQPWVIQEIEDPYLQIIDHHGMDIHEVRRRTLVALILRRILLVHIMVLLFQVVVVVVWYEKWAMD